MIVSATVINPEIRLYDALSTNVVMSNNVRHIVPRQLVYRSDVLSLINHYDRVIVEALLEHLSNFATRHNFSSRINPVSKI